MATGARHAYFGHPEWETLAPGLKTLEDARLIRHRFLRAFEEAERATNSHPADREALLTFVIVGGGPTGVELAGVLPTIAQKGLRPDFRRIDPARARVLLLEGGPRLLPTFPESLSARALDDLETLGVQCRTNALVTRITGDAVYVGEERIATRTVFWAAGNAASPLIRSLQTDLDRAGRALVEPDLSLRGAPHIFVVGDAAAVVDSPRGSSSPGAHPGGADPAAAVRPQYVPGVAPAANQMGTHAARMIAATSSVDLPSSDARKSDLRTLSAPDRPITIPNRDRSALKGLAGRDRLGDACGGAVPQ